MAVKKSIAIIGATEKTGAEIASKLAKNDYRLLLVSNNEKDLTQLLNNIKRNKPIAEIDSIACIKGGCWEADIIILAVDSNDAKEIAEKMKEVATQKIVVQILSQQNGNNSLQHLLPYSKIVMVINILKSKEILITGNDEEANKEISNIFHKAGYQPIISDSFSTIKKIINK